MKRLQDVLAEEVMAASQTIAFADVIDSSTASPTAECTVTTVTIPSNKRKEHVLVCEYSCIKFCRLM